MPMLLSCCSSRWRMSLDTGGREAGSGRLIRTEGPASLIAADTDG